MISAPIELLRLRVRPEDWWKSVNPLLQPPGCCRPSQHQPLSFVVPRFAKTWFFVHVMATMATPRGECKASNLSKDCKEMCEAMWSSICRWDFPLMRPSILWGTIEGNPHV